MAAPEFRDQSLLRVISIGVAAENKSPGSDTVEVVLSEQQTFINGEIRSDFKTDTAKGVDSLGNPWQVSVNMANTVTASWFGDGTNRITSPDIRRGDPIEILQYAEVDTFYWRAIPTPGKSVRKLETVTHFYSNTQDEGDNTPTAENSWHSEVNTHKKVWTTVKTNKNDGEAFAYTQQFDAKNGNAVLGADDDGNYVQMNSKDGIIEIANAVGSFIHLDKGKIILSADEVIIKAKSKFQTTTTEATHNSTSSEYTSTSWNVSVSETTWKGNIGMTGGISVEGGGSFKVNSPADFMGDIKHKGVAIGKDHKHFVNGLQTDTNIVTAS